MSDFLPFVVVGLANGSLYGIAGMGLVLTYKTAGIFNLAHGALAAAAAYGFWELHFRHGLPWPVALLLCVGVAAPLVGLALARLASGLAHVSPAMKIVATVGLLLAVQGTASAVYGPALRDFPAFLPTGLVRLPGVSVSVDQILTVVVAAIAAAGLYAFLRFTRLGLAMRGVVDDPDLLGLDATSPTAVRRWAWVIGSAFAALSGILLAPVIGLDAVILSLLVVQAFGAAAVGAFTSLPLTYAGGLLVGVAAALATKYVPDFPALAGLPPSVPFIVLFTALLVTPRRRLAEAARTARRRVADRPARPRAVRVALGAGLAAAVLAMPELAGTRLPVYTNAAIFVVVFLSLRLLVWTSGQVSLCHAAFAALGATTFSHLTIGAGLPWLAGVVGAGLVTVPLGALVAIPAIRLRGLYLALATFGFGILLEKMAYGMGFMFGIGGTRVASRPEVASLDLSGDTGFYYVAATIAAAAAVLVVGVTRSRLGRLLGALADSPIALAHHGASVNRIRVVVFCLSAFMAGVAGALFGALSGSVGGLAFNSIQSLLWLTVLAISGPGLVSSSVVAALLLAVSPTYIHSSLTEWQPVAFGALAMIAALGSGGRFELTARLHRALERSGDRARRSPVRARTAEAALEGG
jgi:branched-subunit amino acid ABC-type transport system permease component